MLPSMGYKFGIGSYIHREDLQEVLIYDMHWKEGGGGGGGLTS